jgi:hypothetical protein
MRWLPVIVPSGGRTQRNTGLPPIDDRPAALVFDRPGGGGEIGGRSPGPLRCEAGGRTPEEVLAELDLLREATRRAWDLARRVLREIQRRAST